MTGLAEAGASLEALVLELLAPAQREVGLRWERREWNVAQEHAAAAIADAALAVLALGDVAVHRGLVLVGCVEGEWHMLAARMAAEVFRRRGWSVTFLGPSVPALDLAAYAAATAPDAVALSCSLPTSLPGAQRCIHACREEGVAVLVGGAGFGPDGRYAGSVGADAWDADPVWGVRRLDGWLEEPPPARSALAPPDDEQMVLEASRPGLVAQALHRMTSHLPDGFDVATVCDALDMTVAAVEAASLVGAAELLQDCTPMLERALPSGVSESFPIRRILEGFVPELRRRSPRAAALVEATLPAVNRHHRSA